MQFFPPLEEFETARFVIRFAQTTKDLAQVQALRYEVFYIEEEKGLFTESQKDQDTFDSQCHHLMLIEKEQNQIVGTYRVQSEEMAKQSHGFYSATEFDFKTVPSHILKQSVEIGRACIKKQFRNSRALFYLWQGLAIYLSHYKKRYLMGCCSISSQDENLGWQIYSFLEKKEALHPKLSLQATKAFQYPLRKTETTSNHSLIKLPILFQLYLKYGAKICSVPALDKEFKTIDYLLLVDTQMLDKKTYQKFFRYSL
ncbi:MAG: putative hemolysin [bacterium]|jgi:putative hemolysin